jgi:CheY-like chemotaxis protein
MVKGRILIVEDEALTAQDIRWSLEKIGYAVTGVVASGIEAIQRIEESPPDLVILDIFIKGPIDGIETANKITKRFDIPVVYLTGHTDKITIGRAKKTNPAGYILKPYADEKLKIIIERIINKYKK